MQKYLCTPALLYAFFALVQIMFDLFAEMYTLVIVKAFIAVIFTFFLNLLCANGLSVISWILIFIPFIFTLLLFEILIFILSVIKNLRMSEMVNNNGTHNKTGTNNKNVNSSKKYMDISYSETPHNLDLDVEIEEYHNLDLDLEMGLDV